MKAEMKILALNLIKRKLETGEDILISGFGTFKCSGKLRDKINGKGGR